MQDMQREPIAITGIGCRFPGAANPYAFWNLLRTGKDAIREVPADRWKIDALYDPNTAQPGKMMSRWGGFIDQVDQFDWRTFRMLPRELKSMDPQQRLLLEVAWEALEDAGLPFEQLAGSQTSVSIGIGWSDYLRLQSRNWSQFDGYTATGNRSALAANRISYTFDLRGPSISLDTGCSSSLSAIYLACQSLWTGEASLALAGGVNLILSPDSTIMVSKAGLLSADGRCKALDANADGFVRGEGAGIIVLKPLSQVERSDRVYAVIRGITVNHNGHNEWIIASSQAAQEALLRDTYRKADVDPADVDYVELHGTGFKRGDPIEAKALGAVLGASSGRVQPCLIGSVKTNIGHLEAAAGIAGAIKVALGLYHREIPPTLNLQTINPEIPLQDLHLEPQRTHGSWPQKEGVPLAAVTTLALTGANAHLVLAAPPVCTGGGPISEKDALQVRLLPLSARSKEVLYAQATAFKDFLLAQETTVSSSWQDICYTASVRRTHHEYRLAVTGRTPQEAATALASFVQGQPPVAVPAGRNAPPQQHKLVFLFAHQRSQCLMLGSEYLMKEPVFRAVIEECDHVFRRLTTRPLFEDLHNHASSWRLDRSANHSIAHFTFQVALAALWQAWGIAPDAVLGDGLGEIAAAYVAEAVTLEEALHIILELSTLKKDEEIPYQLGSVTIPVYLPTTGLVSKGQRLVATHWGELLKKPELSVPTVDQLLTDNHDIFVELGPPSGLAGAICARQLHLGRAGTIVPSLRQGKETASVLLEALGTLYTQGYAVDWSALYRNEEGRCVSLPTYQWQRERFWLDWLDVEELSTPPEHRGIARQQQAVVEPSLAIETSASSVEETLAKLWADVLGLEQVHVLDSFFELGGHSLLAGQILARIRDMFQVEISLSNLLQAPTPTACAALITESKNTQPDSEATLPMLPLLEPDPSQLYLPFPITDVQQAYWVGRSAAFELGNVGNHGYIEVEAVGLDLARCDLAMQRLIERHEMLRAILLPDGQQQILQHVPPFQIKVVDLREREPEERTAQLEHFRRTMDHQMLPIERWPAFEILAARLDDQKVRLHLSIESLFVDAWSMNLLVKEFVRIYHEPEALLPPLELSFRDYVVAEEALHNSKLYQRSQEYWLKRLPSLPPAPELPLAQTPGVLTRPRFVHRSAKLDVESWQRLKARAAQAGLTPSGVLLAAFAEVLTTWSKTSRFSINLSLFNRLPLHPQVNSIVGDFTSLIVLAVDNSVPETFESRARRLQAQLWSDLDHSVYSGIRVLRELMRQQGAGIKAVMPIVFTSLLIQDTANPYPSPWQETIYCVSQTPQVWLDHQVLEQGGALVFHWQSVDALFPDGLLDAMFEAYCHLLRRLATAEEGWQELVRQLVPKEQLEQRLYVNATDTLVSDSLLHTLFTTQVSHQPQQVAVISPQRALTYQEVYTGSTQLAHELRKLGARPNRLIGVVMEKGWEQVVAVLGILQSGAAYLPIDAGLPKERQMYLLEHGEVEIVLTQSWIGRNIQWPQHIQQLCVDTLNLEKTDVPPLESVQRAEDLAYVIYTSGSTGLPKGVMIDHRGAVNTVLDINQRFNISSNDRVLALSALNFDLSVYDIFGMLAAGGTIVIPPAGSMRNPASWLEMLVRERVTIWNSVPALLQMFVEYTEVQSESLSHSCLRLALLSGDWIPLSLPDGLKRLLPAVEVVSLGGATEASIWSILYPITTIDPAWKSIPYGRPMLNQRFSVLNEMLEPSPTWTPGQLYIGGIGLARGYWHDQEKTEASFFLHPRTGERLYRTGDLGRYLPDGTIEFLGREDFQVKVQGHRIELGEIEETLLRHPAVRAAVATALTASRGEKRLVAYVVPQLEQEVGSNTIAALRSFLKEKLPEYMLPSLIMVLDALPLSSNGKVDRKNLPTPEIASSKLEEAFVAPASEMERTIATVWQDMLPAVKVGIHDNFFDLGGTSILMVRTYNQLRKILSREMSIVEMFFQYPTIHSLAEFLTQGQHIQPSLREIPDQRDGHTESRKGSMQQQRQARLRHRIAERNEKSA